MGMKVQLSSRQDGFLGRKENETGVKVIGLWNQVEIDGKRMRSDPAKADFLQTNALTLMSL